MVCMLYADIFVLLATVGLLALRCCSPTFYCCFFFSGDLSILLCVRERWSLPLSPLPVSLLCLFPEPVLNMFDFLSFVLLYYSSHVWSFFLLLGIA